MSKSSFLQDEQSSIVCPGYIRFIHPSVGGHLGPFYRLSIVIMLLWTWECKCLSSAMFAPVRLLDHVTVLFSFLRNLYSFHSGCYLLFLWTVHKELNFSDPNQHLFSTYFDSSHYYKYAGWYILCGVLHIVWSLVLPESRMCCCYNMTQCLGRNFMDRKWPRGALSEWYLPWCTVVGSSVCPFDLRGSLGQYGAEHPSDQFMCWVLHSASRASGDMLAPQYKCFLHTIFLALSRPCIQWPWFTCLFPS